MPQQDWLPGEKELRQDVVGDHTVTITNLRVQVDSVRGFLTQKKGTTTIPIDNLSLESASISHRWLLIVAAFFLIIGIAGSIYAESGVVMIWAIPGLIFLGFYFLTRKSALVIHSFGESIVMRGVDTERIGNLIMAELQRARELRAGVAVSESDQSARLMS